jgi:O-methyltransferase
MPTTHTAHDRPFMPALSRFCRRMLRQPAAPAGPAVLNEFWQQELDCRYDFFRKALTALAFNGIEGDYAEFGCNSATTFCMVHRLQAEYPYPLGPFHQWAFDSFQGLPAPIEARDDHPRWVTGQYTTPVEEFHRLCKSRGVPRSAYTVVQGYYDTSLAPGVPGPRPDRIRLAYIDCDMYTSTRDVLAFLVPRLQHGMIIAFDDYHCYSPTLPSGERMAALEVFEGNPRWRLAPYVQYGWHGMSFIVESVRADVVAGAL